MIALVLLLGLAQLPSHLSPPSAMATAIGCHHRPDTATVSALGPEPPSNVTLIHVSNGILVSWDDNSDDEDGFIIQRKVYQGTAQIWVPYGAVDADVTHYLDTEPALHEQCEYRVIATVMIGLPSLASAPASISCAPTSVTDEITVSGIRTWPNPANEFISIEWQRKGEAVVEMFDMTGRRLPLAPSAFGHSPLSEGVIGSGADRRCQVDVSHIPNGLYVLQLVQGEVQRSLRIVVQH